MNSSPTPTEIAKTIAYQVDQRIVLAGDAASTQDVLTARLAIASRHGLEYHQVAGCHARFGTVGV